MHSPNVLLYVSLKTSKTNRIFTSYYNLVFRSSKLDETYCNSGIRTNEFESRI